MAKNFEKAYEEKMKVLSRLQYNYEDSDFRSLTVEEFESWKNERGLEGPELEAYRWKTKEVMRVCESYLEAYKEDHISLNGKKGLLESLRSICDKHYRSLFGRIIIEAMGHPSQKKRGPSSNRKWLRAQLRFYMSFLKAQKSGPPMLSFPESTFRDGVKVFYPGNSYDDRIALIRARFHMMGLKNVVPSDDAIRELIRADKKLK